MCTWVSAAEWMSQPGSFRCRCRCCPWPPRDIGYASCSSFKRSQYCYHNVDRAALRQRLPRPWMILKSIFTLKGLQDIGLKETILRFWQIIAVLPCHFLGALMWRRIPAPTLRLDQMHCCVVVGCMGAALSRAAGFLRMSLKKSWSWALRARRGCSGRLISLCASDHSLSESLHAATIHHLWVPNLLTAINQRQPV